jgi:hypothetical protein
MKLYKVYEGSIEAMKNTPCKVVIFADGNNIKIFQKAFYRNKLSRPNSIRNIILEKTKNINSIESVLYSSGFVPKEVH